jgi:hypothetical protein
MKKPAGKGGRSGSGRSLVVNNGDKTVQIWAMPQLPDARQLVTNWVAVKTGFVLSDLGVVRRVSHSEWLKARDDLEKRRGNLKWPC